MNIVTVVHIDNTVDEYVFGTRMFAMAKIQELLLVEVKKGYPVEKHVSSELQKMIIDLLYKTKDFGAKEFNVIKERMVLNAAALHNLYGDSMISFRRE